MLAGSQLRMCKPGGLPANSAHSPEKAPPNERFVVLKDISKGEYLLRCGGAYFRLLFVSLGDCGLEVVEIRTFVHY